MILFKEKFDHSHMVKKENYLKISTGALKNCEYPIPTANKSIRCRITDPDLFIQTSFRTIPFFGHECAKLSSKDQKRFAQLTPFGCYEKTGHSKQEYYADPNRVQIVIGQLKEQKIGKRGKPIQNIAIHTILIPKAICPINSSVITNLVKNDVFKIKSPICFSALRT